jgi:hypothetical protein
VELLVQHVSCGAHGAIDHFHLGSPIPEDNWQARCGRVCMKLMQKIEKNAEDARVCGTFVWLSLSSKYAEQVELWLHAEPLTTSFRLGC